MILRRFMHHIKEQNWFAVGLDVLVVIVGIFLGMQVTEWNDQRKNRIEEQRLLNDLSNDLTDSVSRLDTLLENLSGYNRVIDVAVEKIFSADEQLNLTEDECSDIARAHIAPHLIVQRLSTLDEIRVTGKLPLISNVALRKQILKLYSQLELDASQIGFVVSDLRNLLDNHANTFPRQPSQAGNWVGCDISTIRNNQTVLNKILSNRGRYQGLERRFTEQRLALVDLQNLLEKVTSD